MKLFAPSDWSLAPRAATSTPAASNSASVASASPPSVGIGASTTPWSWKPTAEGARHPIKHCHVPAGHEYRRDRIHVRVRPGGDPSLDAAQVGVGRRQIMLTREQQRHVYRDAGEDRLLDRRQARPSARDLDEHVLAARSRVQVGGGLYGPARVIGQERRDRERDPRIDATSPPVDRGDRGAGANGVDADAAAAVLERERSGQVLHPALADAVPEIVRLGDDLMDARDVDHDARLLIAQEPLDRLARTQERAAQVHREDLVEVRARELLGRSRDLDARVVDEDVETAEALGRLT